MADADDLTQPSFSKSEGPSDQGDDPSGVNGAISVTFGTDGAASSAVQPDFQSQQLDLQSGPFEKGRVPRGRRDDEPPAAPPPVSDEQGDGFDVDMGDTDDDEATLPPAPVVNDASPSSDEDHRVELDGGEDDTELPPASVVSSSGASEGAGGLPAHLSLPSVDFSLPSFDTGNMSFDSDASTGETPLAVPSAGASTNVDLPAHLQLPSFPDFALPPIPGGEGDVPSHEPGSLGEDAPSSETNANALPAHLATPAVDAPAPPPLRPPPVRQKPTPQAPTAPAPGLADLPSFGLPDLGSAQVKRSVTLLGADAAAELAAHPPAKTSKLPFLIIGALLVCIVLGVWQRALIVELFRPEAQVIRETARDRATAILAEGRKAYEAKKYQLARKKFEQALSIDPAYADAHRSMGILLATQKKGADAIEYYKEYLRLVPNAEDAAGVRKIVEDYEKANPPKADESAATTSSKKRRRR